MLYIIKEIQPHPAGETSANSMISMANCQLGRKATQPPAKRVRSIADPRKEQFGREEVGEHTGKARLLQGRFGAGTGGRSGCVWPKSIWCALAELDCQCRPP